MSAQATLPKGTARRAFGSLDAVVACGPLAPCLVACGGIGIALFLWCAAMTRSETLSAAPGLAMILALPIGLALAFAGWMSYGTYFARRGGIDATTALRWDAISWAALGLYAFAPFVPVSIGTPARAAGLSIAAAALVKLLVAARYVYTVRDVLVTFVVTRIPIIVIAELASVVISQRPGVHFAASANPLLAVWGRWDAVHYLDIARRGYYGYDMAFFPLYPGLIALVGRFTGNDLIAGLLISNVSLFFGLLFFYKLAEREYDRSVAHRAIFYVSIFPAAVFFSAVYTESLFFALTVASFYYIREHKWVTAGLLGGLAALTRVEGVLLFVPYLIEVFVPGDAGSWKRFFGTRAQALRVAIGAALIPAGLLLYMAWLWVLRGDPLYFSHVQVHWDRHFAPPWASFWHGISLIATSHSAPTISNQIVEMAFTLLMILVLLFGFQRLRPSFSAYMALSILAPLSTSSLMSMPRFALVMFPMFIILALWGRRTWVNSAVVAFSLSLLGLFTVLFTNWYWVA